MTPTKELVLKDLGTNLRTKIFRNVDDFVAFSQIANITPKDTMAELMVIFVRVTASLAAHQFDISPQEFASVMLEQFANAKKFGEREGWG